MSIILKNYDLIVFGLMSISTMVLLVQSWINIAEKRLTKFSLDALIFFLINIFGSEELKKGLRNHSKNSQRIQMIGIGTLFMALGGIYNSVDWFLTFLS